MNNTNLFLKKHTPSILSTIGIFGVIGTTALAIYETPKAMKLIDEKRKEKGEELSKKEILQTTWKTYIPCITTGVLTITAIASSNHINLKNQAALISAYGILEKTFNEYKKASKMMNENDKDIKTIAKQHISESDYKNIKLKEGESLFFDMQSLRVFPAKWENVINAEKIFNKYYIQSGNACLNDYYDLLGIDRVDFGDMLGWFSCSVDTMYYCEDSEMDFIYDKHICEDGTEYWTIEMPCQPSFCGTY